MHAKLCKGVEIKVEAQGKTQKKTGRLCYLDSEEGEPLCNLVSKIWELSSYRDDVVEPEVIAGVGDRSQNLPSCFRAEPAMAHQRRTTSTIPSSITSWGSLKPEGEIPQLRR